MCLSAEVNFAASAVIGAVGIATLAHVRHPREVLFAAVPLLFALHQFIEGFVWLGLEGYISETALQNSSFLFVLYAHGLLPFLMPLAVLLLEEVPWRRRVLVGITLVAAVFCAYTTQIVVAFPTECFIEHRSIVYRNQVTVQHWTAPVYVFVTCGALVLSGHRVVRWFGLLNLIGLSIIMVVKSYAFSSLWCFYAAVLSIFLYIQFRDRRISVGQAQDRTT